MRPSILHLATIVVVAALMAGCGREARRAEAEAQRAAAAAEEARAREEVAARREADRLAALWSYQETAPGTMHQVTAAVSSANDVDVDGTGAKPVRLIFRDHDSWGRSSYLVLQEATSTATASARCR
ncbi:MAG: hypothetical protein R2712_30710 [Vicinamibacterales bacterium]